MKTSAAKSLFGGVLLSAGLAAAPASGQSFVIGYSYAHVYAFEYASYSSSDDNWASTGPFSIAASVSFQGTDASASIDVSGSQMLLKAAAASPGDFAVGHAGNFASYFTVNQDLTAVMTWDWTNLGGFNGEAQLYDFTNNQFVFNEVGNSSGSTPLQLIAGIDYALFGYVDATANGHDANYSGYTELTVVPAPGVAALLGVAGLSAARRRR